MLKELYYKRQYADVETTSQNYTYRNGAIDEQKWVNTGTQFHIAIPVMEGTEISVSVVGSNSGICNIAFVSEYDYPIGNNTWAHIVGSRSQAYNGSVFSNTVPSGAKYLILPIVDASNYNW